MFFFRCEWFWHRKNHRKHDIKILWSWWNLGAYGHTSSIIIFSITALINASLGDGCLAHFYKKALLQELYKKGTPHSPSETRSIAQLHELSKTRNRFYAAHGLSWNDLQLSHCPQTVLLVVMEDTFEALGSDMITLLSYLTPVKLSTGIEKNLSNLLLWKFSLGNFL